MKVCPECKGDELEFISSDFGRVSSLLTGMKNASTKKDITA